MVLQYRTVLSREHVAMWKPIPSNAVPVITSVWPSRVHTHAAEGRSQSDATWFVQATWAHVTQFKLRASGVQVF